MLDGRHSYNPWLQELPDPISKITWGNYASIAPKKAKELGISEGDEITISVENIQIKLPAQIQVGQHPNLIAIALGYGTKGSKRFTDIGPEWLESEATLLKGETVGENAKSMIDNMGPGILGFNGRLKHPFTHTGHHGHNE